MLSFTLARCHALIAFMVVLGNASTGDRIDEILIRGCCLMRFGSRKVIFLFLLQLNSINLLNYE